MVSFCRVQAGCQQVLQLPVYDPDGDLVRCRWAKLSEAESVVGPTPNTTLFEVNIVNDNYQ